MVIGCWSVKGGVGVTVVASALAMAQRAAGETVLLVDLDGDVATCLGVSPPSGPGVSEWLGAGDEVPPHALARLETVVSPGLSLLHRGAGPLRIERAHLLVQLLAAAGRTVVVDCGRIDRCEVARVLAAEVDRSVLVTRACMLGLQRAAVAPVRPSGVVVVRDPGRSIATASVAEVVGAPVLAEIAVDPALARAVDAGLLAARPPRRLGETLAAVAA